MAIQSHLYIPLEEIVISDGRRPVDADAVKKLAKSIREIGLQHPITVRSVKGEWLLVAGRHRLEAVRSLGERHIAAAIVQMDKTDAEMWEIAENLHRCELSAIQESSQFSRWIELSKIKRENELSADSAQKSRGRPEGGVNAAARELGLAETTAREDLKINSLSDEAKDTAFEVGLEDNRTALLAAARAEPAEQAKVIRDYAEKKESDRNRIDGDVKVRAAREVASMLAEHVPGEWWDALKANLYAAGASNIAAELTNLTGQSIMDRRHGS